VQRAVVAEDHLVGDADDDDDDDDDDADDADDDIIMIDIDMYDTMRVMQTAKEGQSCCVNGATPHPANNPTRPKQRQQYY
jgi:hypothetical protein